MKKVICLFLALFAIQSGNLFGFDWFFGKKKPVKQLPQKPKGLVEENEEEEFVVWTHLSPQEVQERKKRAREKMTRDVAKAIEITTKDKNVLSAIKELKASLNVKGVPNIRGFWENNPGVVSSVGTNLVDLIKKTFDEYKGLRAYRHFSSIGIDHAAVGKSVQSLYKNILSLASGLAKQKGVVEEDNAKSLGLLCTKINSLWKKDSWPKLLNLAKKNGFISSEDKSIKESIAIYVSSLELDRDKYIKHLTELCTQYNYSCDDIVANLKKRVAEIINIIKQTVYFGKTKDEVLKKVYSQVDGQVDFIKQMYDLGQLEKILTNVDQMGKGPQVLELINKIKDVEKEQAKKDFGAELLTQSVWQK